jgi:PAS domain S-box-containing protein
MNQDSTGPASSITAQQYLDLTQTVMVALDTQGRVVMMNRAGRELLGYAEHEIIGCNWFETCLLQPEGMLRVWPVFQRILAGELAVAQPFENQVVRRDGARLLIRWNNAEIRDEAGRLVGVLSSGEDITERKRMERLLCVERDLAKALMAVRTLDDTLALFLDAAISSSGFDAGGVYLVNPETGAMDLRCHRGLTDAFVDAVRHLEPDSPQARIIHEGRPLYARHRELGIPMNGARTAESIRAIAILPIRHRDLVIGCLNIASHADDEVSDHARAVLETLVGQMGQAIAEEQAREALCESEEKYRVLFEHTSEALFVAQDGRIVFHNPRAVSLLDCSAEELRSRPFTDFIHQDDRDMVIDRHIRRLRGDKLPARYAFRVIDGSGAVLWVELNTVAIQWNKKPATLNLMSDITARQQAEAEREELQAQLTQAQKMDSVGRLAGGVAHDFNNMLGVILGYAELALSGLGPDAPLRADLLQIQKAAQRSADLTCQLLAFARKQTVAPRLLDLNETVAGMLKMLRRLIGEHIDLAWKPGHGLWPVMMDPAQIDHILANLCVNARDAISRIGTITIETDNTVFDEVYCDHHAGFFPGEYVLLAVSDDGCGMDAETLSLIFEPFFTTKEVGRGTGLGLATVYGMVQQNNGFVNVVSEPGRGTTFKIYLPRHSARADWAVDEHQQPAAVRGSETILLVEDELAILSMTTMMLERLGYAVLAARTPGEAIRLAREHPDRIALLMTDVVMPEMNGQELAKKLLSIVPEIKRLFMSGYPADVIAHQRMLDKGVHFIQKPFLKKELAAKLREALQQ